jgi:hypothetical protein
MNDYKPSIDFVAKTMDDIRSYEAAASKPRERMNAFLHSKPAFILLSGGGALLAAKNLIEMAWALIFPSICL